MSSELVSEYTVVHAKSKAFYDRYERKEELQHQTHFCPGCGHGIVHKMLASAIEQLGIQDRTILVGPVGCSVFTYYYFDVGNISSAHGRAPAVATAVKRSHPESIVLSYQGDGDLSAIGSAEILHAANRGESITVIFVNNAIYSMTGGQVAPTTLLGQKSSTTPNGRSAANEGYPLHMSELLATLDAPAESPPGVESGDVARVRRTDRAVGKSLRVLQRDQQHVVGAVSVQGGLQAQEPLPGVSRAQPRHLAQRRRCQIRLGHRDTHHRHRSHPRRMALELRVHGRYQLRLLSSLLARLPRSG